MRTVITTIGTSLLTNPKAPWAPWRHGTALPTVEAARTYIADPSLQVVVASAETNTWGKLGVLDEPTRHRVVLLHTKSPDGEFCANRLGDFLQSRKIDHAVEEIAGLDPKHVAGFDHGLAQLARSIAIHVRNGKERGEVAIAATGGFKPETAIASLVGAVVGAPVHYIHEQFRQIVTISPLPISLDLSLVKEGPGRRLLDALGDDTIERASVSSLISSDPRLDLLLETVEIDGTQHVGLNAMGQIALQLIKQPAVEWPKPTALDPMSKDRISTEQHHRPDGWRRCVDALTGSPYVTSVRYRDGHGRSRIELASDRPHENALHAVVSDGKETMGLVIETTAANAAQLRLLLGPLRKATRLQ